jgi:hypothetical protein
MIFTRDIPSLKLTKPAEYRANLRNRLYRRNTIDQPFGQPRLGNRGYLCLQWLSGQHLHQFPKFIFFVGCQLVTFVNFEHRPTFFALTLSAQIEAPSGALTPIPQLSNSMSFRINPLILGSPGVNHARRIVS